jgi:putative intracellular protease/amidase
VKKFSFSVVFTLVAILAIASAAIAGTDALPGSGWWSAEQIQNVGSAQANITITAYDAESTATYPLSDTLDAGAAKNYNPITLGLPDNFQGSAVVSASQDIRAIVNITNRYVTISGNQLGDPASPSPAAGQYQGMNIPSTTINFPLAKNNHYNKTTTYFIQNAGTTAATATATFILFNPGTAQNETFTYVTPSIGPGQMVVVTANDARDLGNNPPPSGNGVVGSLTVTSTQPLAGVCLEHKTTESNATVLQATRAFTSNDYDTKVYIPSNKQNFYGRFSGIQVQNVSGAPIDVNVTYIQSLNAGTGCPGGTKTDSTTNLANGASWTFLSTAQLDNGCFASATVEATGDVVALVNESFLQSWLDTHPDVYQQSTSYGGIAAVSGTTVVSLPMFKENSYAKGTGVSLQNIGDAEATNVVISFIGPTGTYTLLPQTIGMGASIVLTDVRNRTDWSGTPMTPTALGCSPDPLNTTGCGANGLFGVIVEADQPVVAIANESTYPFAAPLIKQDKNNYEGFNLTAAP